MAFSAMLLASSIGSIGAHAQTGADTVYSGGRIYTMDEGRSWAEAVAVKDGEIIYVGGGAGAASLISDETTVIELDGRMMMPAFHDAHVHLLEGGMQLVGCNLDEPESVEAVLSVLSVIR